LLFATASHGRDDQCDGWSAWQRFKRLYLSELIVGSAPRGFAADWIGCRLPDGFVTDLGWLDRRYAFDRSGVLLVKWTAPCGAR
jgi:hypothetical protein